MCDMGVTVSRRPPAVICRQQTAPWLCECRNVSASPFTVVELFNTDSSQHPPLEGGVCEVLQHGQVFSEDNCFRSLGDDQGPWKEKGCQRSS